MKTIYLHETGPLMEYGDGTLVIEDLNPQITTRWKIGRWGAFRMAVKLFIAACKS